MHTSPNPDRLIRITLAVAAVGGPLGYLVGGTLSPSIHASAAEAVAAAAAAHPVTNAMHMLAFVAASYLLPIGAAGLALVAYPRRPWLATIGGLTAVVGWLPFSALTALDDLINRADGQGGYATLIDRFSTDPVMGSYLIVYIVGHLVAYVLLGVALRDDIPRWAASCMIASSPLTIAAFMVPTSGRLPVGSAALTLLLVGSAAAAPAILRSHRSTRTSTPAHRPVRV
jgi:hypothetical protein